MALTKIPASMCAADVAAQAELENAVEAEASARAAADALKLTGDVVKSVFVETYANTTIAANIPNDNTIPQITEGTEILSASITPASATNILQVDLICYGSEIANSSDGVPFALFKDSGADAVAVAVAMGVWSSLNFSSGVAVLRFRVVAGSTAATTFSVRTGIGSGSMILNSAPSGFGSWGGKIASSITITEFKA